ncbi:hypothetical protein LXL04_031545 [Taraxacum kok-saghyz]
MPHLLVYRWQTAGVGECSGKRRQRHSPPANRRRSFTSGKLYLPLHHKKVCQRQTPQKVKKSYVSPTWRSLPLQTLPTTPSSLNNWVELEKLVFILNQQRIFLVRARCGLVNSIANGAIASGDSEGGGAVWRAR